MLGKYFTPLYITKKYIIGPTLTNIPFTTFSELKFESSLLIKNLNTMIISVGYNNIVLGIRRHTWWFSELAFEHPELAKLQIKQCTSQITTTRFF